MKWTIIPETEKENILPGKEFSFAQPSDISFILCDSNRKFWLIPPIAHSESVLCCCISSEELHNIESWKIILKFSSPSLMDLAEYSTQNPEIPFSLFFELLGIKLTHKSVSEWKELGELGENARKLYNIYEFPVNILRLWERLPDEHIEKWLRIFQKHNFKKNIIREIILYLYDLSSENRNQSLAFTEKYSQNWQNTKSPFPSEEIRDFIKLKRYPHSENIQRELVKLKNKLSLSSHTHLHLPADLESETLSITITAKDYEDLMIATAELSDIKKKDLICSMFRILNDQMK